MKKIIAVLMAILMAVAVFAACDTTKQEQTATSTLDPNVPTDDSVIIQIDDYKVTFGDLNEVYNYYYEMYSAYGVLDAENQEEIAEFKQMLLDYQLENILPAFAAKKLEIDLNEEELKELDNMFESQMLTYLSQYDDVIDTEVTDELMIYDAKLALFKDDLNSRGIDYDEFVEDQKEDMYLSLLSNKMLEEKIGEVTVAEDAIKKAYDDKIAELNTKYAEDITSYYADYQNVISGTAALPYVTPEGYYFVTYIFINNESEDIRDYDPEAIVKEVEEKVNELKKEADVDKRIEKFKELITEYGQDAMLQMEPFINEGQLVHNEMTTQYFDIFLETARGLKNKGDISEKFTTENGTIIMMRLENLEAKAVEYDSVKEEIEEELVTEIKNERYSAAMEEWKALVNPVINTQYLEYLGMEIAEPTPTVDPDTGC